ncbi:MAG TPA: hypothetical protein PLU33_12395 [Treponemataceae bacterium]|nr:hypothetical protein [Treponemataceae bacterium]HQL05929.1 hypothetical protein [Treponemataceae bacterium]
MKSKFFAILLIAVMLVLCAACDNGAVHSEDLVLKNGTVITPEIRAKLESMRPEADAVLASIIGEEIVSRAALDEGISLDPEQYDALKDEYIALLKREFGEDYYKYYYEDVEERTVSPDDSMRAAYSTPMSEDAIWQYYLWVEHKTDVWPWGGINVARTEFYGKSKQLDPSLNLYPTRNINIQMISVALTDAITPKKTVTKYGESKVVVYGNWNSGFFKPGAECFVSTHTAQDSRIPGGSKTIVW